jgi:hypothetical protein
MSNVPSDARIWGLELYFYIVSELSGQDGPGSRAFWQDPWGGITNFCNPSAACGVKV